MFGHASQDPIPSARIVAVHPLPGVRAGSGLLRVGNRLLAVQDDAWCIAWISLPGLAIELQPLKGNGAPLPKKRKPDFEGACRTPDGSIYLLGSGSLANRCAVVRVDPARSAVVLAQRPAIHDCVQQALQLAGRSNIEGATVTGDRLRLFHRGVGTRQSGFVDLPLAVLGGAIPVALAARSFDLGRLDGVPCHLTDAAVTRDGRTMFLATAEDTDDAIVDGPVVGSVIGWFDESGDTPTPRWMRLHEADGSPSVRKAEGLAMDDDGNGAWILTDQDDAGVPADLCRVVFGPSA